MWENEYFLRLKIFIESPTISWKKIIFDEKKKYEFVIRKSVEEVTILEICKYLWIMTQHVHRSSAVSPSFLTSEVATSPAS